MSKAVHGVRQGFVIVCHATPGQEKYVDMQSYGDTIEEVRAYARDWYSELQHSGDYSICPCNLKWGAPVEVVEAPKSEATAGPLFKE